MNILDNNLLKCIYVFLHKEELKNCRTISHITNNIVTPMCFINININFKKILDSSFMDVITKYDLYVNAINVESVGQLLMYSKQCNRSKVFKSLRFSHNFNTNIKTKLPSSILYLKFNNEFDKKIVRWTLPSKLQILEFGHNYNQEITHGMLPASLLILIFMSGFNKQILPNVLPNGLVTLILGDQFNNKIVPNSLPNTITLLSFGNNFNQNLIQFDEKDPESNLPKNLVVLYVSDMYTSKLLLDGFTKASCTRKRFTAASYKLRINCIRYTKIE
jgi:hypothetical protein